MSAFIPQKAAAVTPAKSIEETVTIADVLPSADTLVLKDGRSVRLSGIDLMDESVAAAREKLAPLKGKSAEIKFYKGDIDRYGATRARVTVDGTLVQTDLLQSGLATSVSGATDDMLAAEQKARDEKRGFWASAAAMPLYHADAARAIGRTATVTGTVTEVITIRDKTFINFGADWKTDFTITIQRRNWPAFRKANIDLASYMGKKLVARGFVQEANGPMMLVTSPVQIEIVK